jgi:hypothetical protein
MVHVAKRIVASAIRLSCMGCPGPHITRYFMYERLSYCNINQNPGGKVLSISSSRRLCEVLGLGGHEIIETTYPHCSLLSLPFDDNQFDYVVSDQVLDISKEPPNW